MKTKNLIICALFTALIAIGAFIKIPIPVCPITMQVFFTTMAGLLLGGSLGALSVIIYIVIGLIGIPIFTQGGGLGYIFQPTFGYLIGFVIGAYVTGKIANSGELTYKRCLLACFVGLLIIYAIGVVYYYFICNFVINTPMAAWTVFLHCFLLLAPGDIALSFLTAYLAKKLVPILSRIK